MAQDVNAQEVAQVLRSRLGMRWEGERADGIDAMVRALQDGLNMSKSQARDAVDALVTSGEITYNQAPNTVSDSAAGDNTTIPTGGVVALPGSGSSPMPSVALNEQATNGYWRLGRDTTDETTNAPIAGRAGQIDPTA